MTQKETEVFSPLQAAIELWQMLDDIETVSELAKNDDQLYRALIEAKVKERHTILTSDGYDLFIPGTGNLTNITTPN